MSDSIATQIEQLFSLKQRLAIALTGAGGKTTMMLNLANRLPGLVVCTTSTKLAAYEAAYFDEHIVWEEVRTPLPEFLEDLNNILITGVPVQEKGMLKLTSFGEEQLVALKMICDQKNYPLIIEADGARRKPLKAPAAWEPVIPAFTDLVIVVVGLAGLMKTLTEDNVFRSQIFSQLTGLEVGQPVDFTAILRYLKHPMGGLKGVPEKAKKYVLFNLTRCECPELVDLELIDEELNGVFDRFFIESLDLAS